MARFLIDWAVQRPNSAGVPLSNLGDDGQSTYLFWPGQFFAALQQQQPYNSGAASPGTYAQAVQQSAYPDRYDQAFPQAVTLYNQLTQGG